MAKTFSIRQLKNQLDNTWFKTKYWALLHDKNEDLTEEDLIKLLRSAVLFTYCGDSNLKKLGYGIILRYSIMNNDFRPLYDISINLGYAPIANFILNELDEDSRDANTFINSFNSAFLELNKEGDIYLSNGQKSLGKFANETNSDFVLVAPTSYGKSEIIVNQVYQNATNKTCIVVPSKALLAQTKRRIVERENFQETFGRVITHPDMYKGNETHFIGVLTQERLLRLLQKNPELSLDTVLIDEAHNMMGEDKRAILLTQVVMILKKRNNNLRLKFFTPFISDSESLTSRFSNYQLEESTVSEHLKIERFFICDLTTDKKLYQYDQFIDDFKSSSNVIYQNDVSFLKRNKANKNIVYINRPRDIVSLAKLLSSRMGNVEELSPELEEAILAIQDYLNPAYDLLKCLKSGVVYHHGGMPENVRLYVENAFSKIDNLQFVVTSSTLLEGVNIPAEKIFLLTTKIGRRNFSKSQFRNLIGRVCRFSEVFHASKGNLELLEPQIFLVKGDYEWSSANTADFLKKKARVDIKFKDDVQNVLLKKEENLTDEDKEELDKSLVYVENIENDTVVINEEKYAQYDIGKFCFSNNVYDFDIGENEETLQANITAYLDLIDNKISTVNDVLEAVNSIFISGVNVTENNLSRLENESARKFYSMFLSWRSKGSSYNEMINQFVTYWSTLNNPIIYVGSKWGEIKLNEDHIKTLYIDLSDKSDGARVNLAIVRIKEEQDYVDNTLMKYVEILNDLDLLATDFYEKLKYGSSDSKVVTLLKNGFSIELAKLITTIVYRPFVLVVPATDTITIAPDIVQVMRVREENPILIYELEYHIG